METLLDFLKTYSDVDIKFIQDFMHIREGDKTHDPFRIDIEIMAKWLDTRKDTIKDTLVKSYQENVDYMSFRADPERFEKSYDFICF
jgi:hypothetical protein